MTDDAGRDKTEAHVDDDDLLSRLGERFEEEVLSALGNRDSPLRVADLYLIMSPFVASVIGKVLDRLVRARKVECGEYGLFWRAGERAASVPFERLPKDSDETEPKVVSDRENDAASDEPVPTVVADEQPNLSAVVEDSPWKSDASQLPAEVSQEGIVTLTADGTTYEIDLGRFRVQHLSFGSLPEKAVFLRLIDFPLSGIMGELGCRYQDLDDLVIAGIAEEPWMPNVEGARRYAQMNPDWVADQHTLLSWAASLFLEDRKLFSALFMGEDFERASRFAGVSTHTAAKILADNLRTFPQLDNLAQAVSKVAKLAEEQDVLSGGASDGDVVTLGPFAFGDESDAVMFLRELGATSEQVSRRLGIDADRCDALLTQGEDRMRGRAREGRGNLRFDLCAWARTLRRSDARLVLLSLLDDDPRSASSGTSYSLHELTSRLDKILETAPSLHRHDERPDTDRLAGAVAPAPKPSHTTSRGEESADDRWPPCLKESGERGLFVALLGAGHMERARIVGESSSRLDGLIRDAARRDPDIAKAFVRHPDGRCSLSSSLVKATFYGAHGNLMVWASRLSLQEKKILLGWLAGESEQQIAQGRVHASVPRVHGTLERLLSHCSTATYDPRSVVPAPPAHEPDKQKCSMTTDGPLPLAQWLASLDRVTRGALLALFSGGRVSDFAIRNGISTADARRAYQNALRLRPCLVEDRYLYLYETYNVSSEDFTELTGLGSESYGYLKNISSRGGGYRHLRPAGLNDKRLPQEVRDRLRDGNAGVASSNLLRIDGKLVRLSFEGLVRHFGSVHAQARPVSTGEFCAAYKEFLDNLGLGDREDLGLPENPQTAIQKLTRTDWFLIASSKHVRYYDYDSYDFSPLVEVLRAAAGRNVECSAKVVFRANRTLMETFDLVDEYDLFVVAKRLIRETGIPGVQTGKCPILRFGECDRHAQILGIIKEVSPATADEVAAVYEERFGVSPASFKSSYLREFAAYQRNGRYEYHERELTEDMGEFLRGELKGDYLVLSLVQARFAAKFSQASKLDVNDMALAPFGYHTSHDLIVRDGIDERAVFGALIDAHDQFALGDVGFDEAITKYPAFRSELRAHLASLSYVEWMRGHYLSVARLSSAFGIGERELRSYMRHVSGLAEPGVPFTVPGLLIAGKRHELDSLRDDAGVEDSLYEGLIDFMPASEGIKRTSFDGTNVYCRSHGSFSTADFLSYLARREGHVGLEDLVDFLEDEYGIRTSIGYVRNCVERAASEGAVFHNQALDTLLPSKEANAAFVRSCIDGD